MEYPHTIEIKEIPVPPKTIMTVITTDYGSHKTKNEFYAEPEDFLKFWQPLVTYYEKVKNEQNN